MANRKNGLSETLKSLWPAGVIVLLVTMTFILLYPGMDAILARYDRYSYEQYIKDALACADNYTSTIMKMGGSSTSNFSTTLCSAWYKQVECRKQAAIRIKLDFIADQLVKDTFCNLV